MFKSKEAKDKKGQGKTDIVANGPALALEAFLGNVEGKKEENRSVIHGLPFVLHDVLSSGAEEEEFARLLMEDAAPRSEQHTIAACALMSTWAQLGRPISADLMERMIKWAKEATLRQPLAVSLQRVLDARSPIVGRWRSEHTPSSNIFAWIHWSPSAMGAALTALCAPFYSLRCSEFSGVDGDPSKPSGRHLAELNRRYQCISMLVTTSVLASCVVSRRQGLASMERWLDTAEDLRARHNYHMLFAVQNALQRHQVDRLKFIHKGISRRHAKIKKSLDSLFSATDRMKQLKAEVKVVAGKEPMVPCIFWLVQKVTLLQETPLVTSKGALNVPRVTAAFNIFHDLELMRLVPYKSLQEDEQIMWYIMSLERETLCSEDELYLMSDAANKEAQKLSIPSSGARRLSEPSGGAARSPTKAPKAPKAQLSDTTSMSSRSQDDDSSDSGMAGSSESKALESVSPMSIAGVLELATNAMSGKTDAKFLGHVAALF